MRNKVITAITVAALALTLTGCGGNDNISRDNDRGVESGASVPETTSKNFKYTIASGEVCIDEYIGSGAQVSIPAKIEEYPVRFIADCAFSEKTDLETIVIPDTVNHIGDRAFYRCKSLSSISIPNSVTEIADFAFCACDRLASVTISKSLTEIGYGVFSDCVNLTSVTIPNSVTEIGDFAFNSCVSLVNIDIPDSVTVISDCAFYDCPKIQAAYKGKTYDYEHIEDLYKAINGN